MQYSDFALNGVLASSLGILATQQPGYIRPSERRRDTVIAGRSGALMQRETTYGVRVYDSVDYAIGITILPWADTEAAMAWLAGGGLLEMGSVPGWAFEATITGQVATEVLIEGDPAYQTMTVVYTCHPCRMPTEMASGYYPAAGYAAAAKALIGSAQGLDLARMAVRVYLGPYAGLAGTLTVTRENQAPGTLETVTRSMVLALDSDTVIDVARRIIYNPSTYATKASKVTGDWLIFPPREGASPAIVDRFYVSLTVTTPGGVVLTSDAAETGTKCMVKIMPDWRRI